MYYTIYYTIYYILYTIYTYAYIYIYNILLLCVGLAARGVLAGLGRSIASLQPRLIIYILTS